MAPPFAYFPGPTTWQDAEQFCISLGAHLASIRTPEENDAVHNLCGPEPCWIGFNDIAEEGTWVWSDGWPADFTGFPQGMAPWNLGEPNGQPDEQTDGAYMYPSSQNHYVREGLWDDDDINHYKAFVCRGSPAPSPPPSPSPPPYPSTDGEFSFHSPIADWSTAEQSCIGLGGHLASIHSKEENERVQRLCGPNPCWIGYHLNADEGRFVWSDNSPANFTGRGFYGDIPPWIPDNPTGRPNQNGAFMVPGDPRYAPGAWADKDVSINIYFVCRIHASPASPPPSLPPATPPPSLPPAKGGGGGAVVTILLLLILVGGAVLAYYKRESLGIDKFLAGIGGDVAGGRTAVGERQTTAVLPRNMPISTAAITSDMTGAGAGGYVAPIVSAQPLDAAQVQVATEESTSTRNSAALARARSANTRSPA